MPVTVEIGGVPATISRYVWKSKDKGLQKTLQLMLDPIGPSGADPYPDLTAAKEAVKKLGGKVTDHGTPAKYEPGVVN
jgi:hypothetical protein